MRRWHQLTPLEMHNTNAFDANERCREKCGKGGVLGACIKRVKIHKSISE